MNGYPRGRIKDRPEDFVVEEIPAYSPTGEGAHIFVRFTKTDRTTLDAVNAIALALGCDPRAAGYAGMKDKRAVTTQTMSLQVPDGIAAAELSARALALTLDGVVTVDARPHQHKIKPGHLAGNRFAVAVRGVSRERVHEVTRALDRIASEGLPNAFGAQRYGREKDNTERALAWLRGEARPPRERRLQRLLWSSVQSTIFDAVLDARLKDQTWATPLEGDLLKLRSSGGLFLCADVQTDYERARRGEVSPTGPMIGARMRWPEGVPAQLERRIVSSILGDAFDLGATRSLGEGTRRPLRVTVEGLRYDIGDSDDEDRAACIWVYFVLPKGVYATTLLGAAVALEDRSPSGATGPRANDPPEERSE